MASAHSAPIRRLKKISGATEWHQSFAVDRTNGASDSFQIELNWHSYSPGDLARIHALQPYNHGFTYFPR
jgi:hypothetical protein